MSRKPKPTNLVSWEGYERAKLISHLRDAVKPSAGPQTKLFVQLLRRMELAEFSSRKKSRQLSAKSAAMIMGIAWESADKELYTHVSRLREKVSKASKKLKPNPGAYLTHAPYEIEVTKRPPSSRKLRTVPAIGMLLADAADWFVGEFIKGVSEVCEREHYELLVDVSSYSPKMEAKKIRHLIERTDGILIVPVGDRALPPADRLLRDNHCVLMDRYLYNAPDVPSVHPDDFSAGRAAGIYLKNAPCSRILIVKQGSRSGSSFSITPLEDRVAGCQQLDGDIEVKPLPAMGTDEQGGYDALKHFEEMEPLTPTDGIFALTDRVAVGCMYYLLDKHPLWKLPVIGVEGQAFGDYMKPHLPSIRFGNVELGRRAAEVLIAKLKTGKLPETDCPPHYLIPPILLEPSEQSRRNRQAIDFPDRLAYYFHGKRP